MSAVEWISTKLIAGTSKSPFLWRLSQSKRLRGLVNLREKRSRPYLRRYVFPWAVARMKERYNKSEEEVTAESKT